MQTEEPEKESKGAYPVITVMQGRAWSPYFKIIQPVPGIPFNVGQEVHCINPKNGKLIRGIVTEHFWTFPWKEAPTGFLLGEYGVAPGLLRTVLIASDASFDTDWARVIELKEIGNTSHFNNGETGN